MAHAIGIHNDHFMIHRYDWPRQVPQSKLNDYRAAAYCRLGERLGDMALGGKCVMLAPTPNPFDPLAPQVFFTFGIDRIFDNRSHIVETI